MQNVGKPLALAGLLFAGALCANTVHAAPFVVTVSQQGGNVVAAGSGAFDVTGLTKGSQTCFGQAGLGPNTSVTLLGTGSQNCDYYYLTSPFSGPGNFGPGTGTTGTGAGDVVTLIPNLSLISQNSPAYGLLLVPQGYVPDSTLSGNVTLTNATYAGLGLTPGTYTWSWGNGADQSFTLDILAAPPPPAPSYVVRIYQQGGNVVAVGSGWLDLTGLNAPQQGACPAALAIPFGAAIVLGSSANCDFYNFPTSLPGPTSFGNGMPVYASSGTGDSVGFGGSLFSAFAVPAGYVSDALLSGTATWSNATFASLGLTPGTYTWNWGNDANQMFTVEIGTFAIGVPEPSALALFGGGLLLLGAFVGLRRRMA